MDIFEKIAAQGKALALHAKDEYSKIKSAAVRLTLIAFCLIVIVIIVLKALPILLLVAGAVGAYLCVKALIAEDQDGR